jgi:hypothetical protein
MLPLNDPEVLLTAGIFAISAAFAGFLVYLERKPREAFKPRFFPTTPVLFVTALIGILALVHLINLYGFHTGRN